MANVGASLGWHSQATVGIISLVCGFEPRYGLLNHLGEKRWLGRLFAVLRHLFCGDPAYANSFLHSVWTFGHLLSPSLMSLATLLSYRGGTLLLRDLPSLLFYQFQSRYCGEWVGVNP